MFPVTLKKRPILLNNSIRRLGLTGGLKLLLDAGDAASYTSGVKWLDLSGGGYDFDFGAGAAAPTFTGTAGAASKNEYMSFDGGDYCTYDAANESWMDNLHKDNAKWAAAWWGWVGAIGSLQGVFGTGDTALTNIGVKVYYNSSNVITAQVANGTGGAALSQNGPSVAAGAWNFYAVRMDEATGAGGLRYIKDSGTVTDDSATYSSPSAAAATYTMQIGAAGNNLTPLSNGSRLAALALWEGTVPTFEQLQALYFLTAPRFA